MNTDRNTINATPMQQAWSAAAAARSAHQSIFMANAMDPHGGMHDDQASSSQRLSLASRPDPNVPPRMDVTKDTNKFFGNLVVRDRAMHMETKRRTSQIGEKPDAHMADAWPGFGKNELSELPGKTDRKLLLGELFEEKQLEDRTQRDLESQSVTYETPALGENPQLDRLKDLMKESEESMMKLQQWDRDRGLPKSHSKSMVNTSRSRQQIITGKILSKWDGTPLINNQTELGKPKKRRLKDESELKTKRRRKRGESEQPVPPTQEQVQEVTRRLAQQSLQHAMQQSPSSLSGRSMSPTRESKSNPGQPNEPKPHI
uniref:Uncharacterized protein n=1 Tax=Craspedostauros australis TaxID=1486917 RepID=A0A6T6HZD9_9STRA